jgi:hypothetical protein
MASELAKARIRTMDVRNFQSGFGEKFSRMLMLMAVAACNGTRGAQRHGPRHTCWLCSGADSTVGGQGDDGLRRGHSGAYKDRAGPAAKEAVPALSATLTNNTDANVSYQAVLALGEIGSGTPGHTLDPQPS